MDDQLSTDNSSRLAIEQIEPTKSSKKRGRLILVAIIFAILTLVLLIGGVISWYTTQFEQKAGISLFELSDIAWQGSQKDPYGADGNFVVLLLGLDTIEAQREGSLLTDTMMLIALQKTGRVTMLSIPRDLWINSLKTKINALYYYGEQEAPGDGELLVKEVIRDISDVRVDATVTLTTSTVIDLIDILGGVEVEVERGFVDDAFPRWDVNPASSNEEDLYMNVSFEAGRQLMDGQRALVFMRSRHSDDESEGTDIARSNRQQLVLRSIGEKLSEANILLNPQTLGTLYDYYEHQIDTDLTISQMSGLLSHTNLSELIFSSASIPITTDEQMGILYHPQVFENSQWVYLPYDRSYGELKDFITSTLLMK